MDDRLDDRLVLCRVVFGGLEGKRRGSCRRSRDCFLSVGSRGEAIRSAATADVRTSDVRRQDCQDGQRAGVRRPSPTRRWNGAMLLNQLDASEFAFNVCSADVDVGAGADVEMLRSCSCRSAVVVLRWSFCGGDGRCVVVTIPGTNRLDIVSLRAFTSSRPIALVVIPHRTALTESKQRTPRTAF